MDHVDHMALSGSASYYMQQRGLAGSGSQPELHVSPSIHQLSNPNLQFQSSIGGGHNIGSTLPLESSTISSQGINVSGPTGVPSGETVKRKRGRPRKYGSDRVVSLALSPSPTPSSNPGTMSQGGLKRGRGRPPGSGKKQQLASLGGSMLGSVIGSVGTGLTPHIIYIANGEDIASKILAFSQATSRAVIVMAGHGAVSTATIRQPSISGGTIKFEGHFQILSLTGSYLPAENGSSRNRTGGISVILSHPDNRCVGGSIGGQLIALGPAQVIVGTFLWGRLNANKKESSEDAVKSDGAHNPVALNSISPSPNHTPTSSASPWSSASRPMDVRTAHGDIDLMRG